MCACFNFVSGANLSGAPPPRDSSGRGASFLFPRGSASERVSARPLRGRRGREEERRYQRESISSPTAGRRRNGFGGERRRQQTKKAKSSPLSLSLIQKIHSALGDIGNLVAPLARVNVSQAEKARAQEVRGREGGETATAKSKEKAIRASRAASLFRRRRREREESGKGRRRQFGSRGKRGAACSPTFLLFLLLLVLEAQEISLPAAGVERG